MGILCNSPFLLVFLASQMECVLFSQVFVGNQNTSINLTLEKKIISTFPSNSQSTDLGLFQRIELNFWVKKKITQGGLFSSKFFPKAILVFLQFFYFHISASSWDQWTVIQICEIYYLIHHKIALPPSP